MLNATPAHVATTYFRNSVGHLLEHPHGHYIAVEYYAGPRLLTDLHAFLSHAGQLLAHWGWDKLLTPNQQMPALTPEEINWLTEFWRTKAHQRSDMLYGALLLPHDVF
ncbi:MAG: hypothetical protein EOO63_09065, partial [Hymenobacter sp.]